MPLCHLCSNLDLYAISQATVSDLFRLGETTYPDHSLFLYTSRYYDLPPAENNLTPHYNSLHALSASARSCALCSVIQSSINSFLKGCESRKKLGFRESPDYELLLGGRDDADGFQVLGSERGSTRRRLVYFLLGGVGFCLDDGKYKDHNLLLPTKYLTAAGLESHLKNIIRGRKVPPSPVSLPVLEKIRGWVERCTEEYKHVRSVPKWIPTRLLKITDLGREVCLHTTDGADIQYTTLSHCWGTIAPTALTSHTLQRFKTGIKTNELPRTFQDAIWLTHQLHISFIWIDSLCIFQDDPGDWKKESASMHHVYENSSVTIAASRAANSLEGFLGKRIERSYLPVPFAYRGIAGEILAFDLALNCVGDPKRTVWMEHEPLTARGWALQERYLSRLTLHFTRHQILFETQRHCLAESISSSRKLPSMTRIMSGDYFKEVDRKTYLQDWYRLVQIYSMRKLTISDDKLPALSGLAAHFSSYLGLPYRAGLWSHDVIRGLCWGSSQALRPPNYRAPTWSWASIDGRIEYGIPWLDSLNELACAESTHVDLESPERIFGKVLGGSISMKVIKLRPYAKDKPENRNLWFSEDGASFRLGFSWDLETYRSREKSGSLASIIDETDLIVVPLGWIPKQLQGPDDPNRLLGPFCLVLETVQSPSYSHTSVPTFQRVGSGMIMHGPHDEGGLSKDELKRLIIDKWIIRKEQGKLEEILII